MKRSTLVAVGATAGAVLALAVPLVVAGAADADSGVRLKLVETSIGFHSLDVPAPKADGLAGDLGVFESTLSKNGRTVGRLEGSCIQIRADGSLDDCDVTVTVGKSSYRMSGPFDPAKGGKLSTYAAWWIKQSMKRALANQSKTVQVAFRPGAPQQYDGWLQIDPDAAGDPSLQPVYIFLSGQGLATTITCITAAQDNSLDFGVVGVGMPATLSIQVLNGGTAATQLAVTPSLPQVVLDHSMLTLGAASKGMVLATFTPDVAQAYSGHYTRPAPVAPVTAPAPH